MASRSTKEKAIRTDNPIRGNELALRRADGTLTDVIQIKVRDAILMGDYRPGQKLPITTMAQQNNVSLGVMREALTRLTVDGLVTSTAMQGFSVMQTSLKDLDEVGQLLKQLMGTAIRNSVKNGNSEWEASLIAAQHLFKRAVMGTVAGPRSAEVDKAHNIFWEALISACGNARLIAILQSLYRSMQLYHRLAIILLKDDATALATTYWAITEAAVAGDVEATERLMLDDIDRAVSACRAYLRGVLKLPGAGT